MNTAVTTIIAAGIAVLGTLLSPVLVQYTTARAKAQEYELARQQRQEEREAEAQVNKYVELRRAYTELNTEMRSFVRALSNYMHLVSSNQCSPEARNALNQVREKYLDCFADAQMMVSDEVSAAAADANTGLGRLYGMTLRLDGFTVPTNLRVSRSEAVQGCPWLTAGDRSFPLVLAGCGTAAVMLDS